MGMGMRHSLIFQLIIGSAFACARSLIVKRERKAARRFSIDEAAGSMALPFPPLKIAPSRRRCRGASEIER
jgi:hypothetical protein